jgi:hypothetical protein
VHRASSLGCALLVGSLAACQQTWKLDDLGPDASQPGTGGMGSTGSAGGKGGSSPTDASTDGRCSSNGQTLKYTPDLPQMLVALDRSTAMSAEFPNTNESHLDAALNAILGEVDAYSGGPNHRGTIQFSFLDFPDTGSGCDSSSGCCPSDITTSYNTFSQSAGACTTQPGPTSCLQSSSRPMATALSSAHDYFQFMSGGSHATERYVLLISDGNPQGCSSDDPCNDAITKVNDLSGIDVTTEAVAIGSDAGCLTVLANTQGLSPSPYYLATTPADVSNTIAGIALTVAEGGCRLTLSMPPASGRLAVYFDNVAQMQDSGTMGNGWNYDNSTHVYLHGTLCTSFLQAPPNSQFGLQIYDGCGPDHLGGNP